MKHRSNEQGMVSITVTIILMIVISLTVLSFAQIIRREERQALDNQLSTQAYYAAESGVNDAKEYIAANFANAEVPDKTNCAADPKYSGFMTASPSTSTSTIDSATNTGYTCVLITNDPTSLKYDLASSSPSVAFPIDGASNVIRKISFSWRPKSGAASPTGCAATPGPGATAVLPTQTNWGCDYGMLRVDLVPASDLSRSGLAGGTFTAFLTPANPGSTNEVPFNSGSNVNGGAANQGARPAARCTAIADGDQAAGCTVTIAMPATMNNTLYYARVSTLYRDSAVTITALDNSGKALALSNAQLMIDSTGKSQDVLRRIQVRLPLDYAGANSGNGAYSDYGLESTNSVCKTFSSFSGYSNNSGC